MNDDHDIHADVFTASKSKAEELELKLDRAGASCFVSWKHRKWTVHVRYNFNDAAHVGRVLWEDANAE